MDNVKIHSGTVIGADGFGFVNENQSITKIPQTGDVVIESNVEIGSNCIIKNNVIIKNANLNYKQNTSEANGWILQLNFLYVEILIKFCYVLHIPGFASSLNRIEKGNYQLISILNLLLGP